MRFPLHLTAIMIGLLIHLSQPPCAESLMSNQNSNTTSLRFRSISQRSFNAPPFPKKFLPCTCDENLCSRIEDTRAGYQVCIRSQYTGSKACLLKVAAILAALGVAGWAFSTAIPWALAIVGFGTKGVLAGSLAAKIQRLWGTGGLFAALQSAGALGKVSFTTKALFTLLGPSLYAFIREPCFREAAESCCGEMVIC